MFLLRLHLNRRKTSQTICQFYISHNYVLSCGFPPTGIPSALHAGLLPCCLLKPLVLRHLRGKSCTPCCHILYILQQQWFPTPACPHHLTPFVWSHQTFISILELTGGKEGTFFLHHFACWSLSWSLMSLQWHLTYGLHSCGLTRLCLVCSVWGRKNGARNWVWMPTDGGGRHRTLLACIEVWSLTRISKSQER